MSQTESKFVKLSVAVLVIALLVFFVPGWWRDFVGSRQKILGQRPETEASPMSESEPKMGIIEEGDYQGMEVDMSGALLMEDLKNGTGPEVQEGDTVVVHYTGTLEDGTVFDSSVERETPFETQIGVGQVIQGWDEGILGMKVGGKRRLTVPPAMGYGDRAVGKIPAGSTLIFEVELLEIK